MAKLSRVVLRLAMSAVFMIAAASASADEDLTYDEDFQKGLAIGAALAHQSAELGFGEPPGEADATFATSPTAGYVATFAYEGDEINGDDSPRLSDLLGFTMNGRQAPDSGVAPRPYSLADALVEWRWRQKVARDLRERLD